MSPCNVPCCVVLVPVRPAVRVGFAGVYRRLRASWILWSGVALVSVVDWWCIGLPFSRYNLPSTSCPCK